MRNVPVKASWLLSLAAAATTLLTPGAWAQPRVESDGTVHVPAFELPESSYLSEESRVAMKYFREVYAPEFGTFRGDCPNVAEVADDVAAARAARQCIANGYYETSIYRDTRAKHPVVITHETIGGVYTEVFVPAGGIAAENEKRLLISIHGGGFVTGARSFSHTEAMQVADRGRIKVISPDYRMAPEFEHPAAVDDVVAVYKSVLEDYDASNVGIYGCSAGAMLTAQTIAYLEQNDLPLPGAIGLFCAGLPMTDGDVAGVFKMSRSESAFIVSALGGSPRSVGNETPPTPSPYFRDVKLGDP